MLNQHYAESRTPAVWLCVGYSPKKPYPVKLKKVAGRHDVGGFMELTAENHAQNIERGVYAKIIYKKDSNKFAHINISM